MKTNFSPSINILRDVSADFYYIPTANSIDIYNQISSQFASGVHSFNIVGSYGTGKSAFLLALSKHLNSDKQYFSPVNGQFNKCKKFEFLSLVGDYSSIVTSFANKLGVTPVPSEIITELKKRHDELRNSTTCLVIVLDEFGKFLEYAVKNNPDEELYFVQQLAEFANDKETNVLFLSTLHQNFDAYSAGLSKSQRAEWEKVKGRLKELTFNEPIEQLLFLVTEHLKKEKNQNQQVKGVYNKEFISRIRESGIFDAKTKDVKNFVESLYPFDLLSAMVLTRALQQYGQNERSLFHFLQTDERYGLTDYNIEEHPYYDISCVYDYLQYNYYSVLTSKYNPAFSKWSTLRNSIERVEIELVEHVEEAKKIIKTIGLLNILGGNAAKINDDLLLAYGEVALGLGNTEAILNLLLKKKIIRYQKYNDRYKLFEGTDIDIDELIEEKRISTEPVIDLIAELRDKFKLGIVQAKAVTYKYGTPRFFDFKISDIPILQFKPKDGTIDGYINLIFNEEPSLEKISSVSQEPIIYGVYKDTSFVKNLLHDIKVSQAALDSIGNDKVAREELDERLQYHTDALNEALNNELFDKEVKVQWYFDGELLQLNNRRDFNKQLSRICESLFKHTPIFKNELMNKHKPSSSVHTAKKIYFKHLLECYKDPYLGFPKDKNPAEKTIYTTLLKSTGIHVKDGSFATFAEKPSEKSFLKLWDASVQFLDSAKIAKRSLQEFVDILRSQPFQLKDGFIEFWIGTFLFIHREDFALFRDAYIPKFSLDMLELLFKEAKKFQIKTFNVEGVRLELFNKYREIIQAKYEESVKSTTFKETATPFLMFYKKLPIYTQNTDRLSKKTLGFRGVLEKAKELEKTFFEDLPAIFGLTLDSINDSEEQLELFVGDVQSSIRELRLAFTELVNRVEKGLLQVLGFGDVEFPKYVDKIKDRYKNIKVHLLLPHQQKFYNRLLSQIDDKESWINNVIHSLLNKRITDISDKDEAIIFDKLKDAFQELDDLIELSKANISSNEEVIRVKLSANQEKTLSKNIIITPKQKKEVSKLEASIKEILSKDKKINQAVLVKLLKKYL